MNPKDKAKELANKFYSINKDGDQRLGTNPYISREYAKECALLCVDELIKAFKNFSISEHGGVHIDYGHGEWELVKQELKKL